MRKRLIDMLQDAIEAERQAADLRRAHGLSAERYCDELMTGCRKNDPQRERLQDVRRALRWL